MFTAVDEMPIDEMPIDELQRVRFESVVETNHHRGEGIASFSRYVRGASGGGAVSAHLSKILQFVSPPPFPQNRFLVAGDPPAATGKKRRTVDSDAT